MFNKPIKGGSFLTQRLHGRTLGSSDRRHGYGVGYERPVAGSPKYLEAPVPTCVGVRGGGFLMGSMPNGEEDDYYDEEEEDEEGGGRTMN